MMKKDISANLYQKCLILCRKILLNVLHNFSLTVLLPWKHTHYWVPDLPNIKGISGHLWHSIFIFANGGSYTVYMIQQAYKYVSVSLWPCLTFFGLKITYILKSSVWGLRKSELPWEQNVLKS